jgi:hypothetical protein
MYRRITLHELLGWRFLAKSVTHLKTFVNLDARFMLLLPDLGQHWNIPTHVLADASIVSFLENPCSFSDLLHEYRQKEAETVTAALQG